ncbi:MAG: histidine phosphatase family protein, partial [Steroidobacteraceae bacterium]
MFLVSFHYVIPKNFPAISTYCRLFRRHKAANYTPIGSHLNRFVLRCNDDCRAERSGPSDRPRRLRVPPRRIRPSPPPSGGRPVSGPRYTAAPMAHLHLVRHGQPDFAGNYDSITAVGAQQSRWLGAHFAGRGLHFARVVSGTLQRQADTCDLIVQQLATAGVPARDARFNEYDHASLLAFFEGERVQALRAAGDRRGYFTAIRHALQQWARHEGPVHGGETWAQFGARIAAAVDAVCAGVERDEHVLIVTSGG